MLDEEQISFRSASLMIDGVEDYSHQIAEMIGLRNESNFIKSGVSGLNVNFKSFCIKLFPFEASIFFPHFFACPSLLCIFSMSV